MLRFGLRADTTVHDGGRVLIGGSPLKVLRLSAAGAEAIAEFTDPNADLRAGSTELGLRLADGGVAETLVDPGSPTACPATVTVVVPVRDDPFGLARTLEALAAEVPTVRVIVVDDASTVPVVIRQVRHMAGSDGPELLRRPISGGPGAARTTGLGSVSTPWVVFIDAGVVPQAGWFDELGRVAVAVPGLALVAPRIVATPGPRLLDRYEAVASPLDLGPTSGPVRPASRLSYVPSTMLWCATDVVSGLGFDPDLRFGEDVDLVWRMATAGHRCRYEPAVVAAHPARRSWWGLARQRFGYGTAAAPLDRRHPGAAAPVAMSPWSLAIAGLVVAGHPLAGAAIAVGTGVALERKLAILDGSGRRTAHRLVIRGHLGAAEQLANAVIRPWLPFTLAASMCSRRIRRGAVVAAVGTSLMEWRRRSPGIDPVTWTALHWLDDGAYTAGVWVGAVRQRSSGPLRPRLRSWPGRSGSPS